MKIRVAAIVMTIVIATGLVAWGDSSSAQSEDTASTEDEDVSSDESDSTSEEIVDIDGEYTWNVAMNVSESTLNYYFYEIFKDELETRSAGKITMNLYPNGQLGGDAEQLYDLMDKTVDFSTTITSGMTSTVSEYAIFDLPNAVTSIEQMRSVEDNEELLEALNEASAEKNIYLMGLTDAGFRELTSDKEVNSIDDLSGLKIRVIDNQYHQAYWTALGASTTTMDFNEVYSSLQQKVIDGEENPYMNITSNKFYEVQPYVIETNHLGHIMVFTMNKPLYDSLPENVQLLVDECAKDAIIQIREAADESIEEYKQTIVDYGCEIITLDESVLEEMQEKASSVYDMVRSDIGDDLVDIFLSACDSAK